ncbi:hypothetical protein KKF23_04040 [Patescibacteria group bacterium]|nr:hypothetical protein [Patescibacteria group bacterium]
MKLKIEIIGNRASVFLLGGKNNIIAESNWIDERDLSEKLLSKIDSLLKKNNLSIKNISKVDFNCDSPYFGKNKKINLEENLSSKNKCGFTSWQTGEITAKILNLACQPRIEMSYLPPE